MDLNEQTLSKPLGTPTGRDALETPVILVDDPKVQDGAAKSQRSSSKLRWLVLMLACLSAFGNYFCFDNPTALSEALKERLHLSSLEYNLLYSLYSFPNMVLPLFGGVFIDRVGVNTGLILFTGLLCGGQALFALGVSNSSYILALIGRFVFGLGGECQGVAVVTIVAVWFRNKEMAFAMGLMISVSRLGSVANDQISPFWKNEAGLSFAIWFGFLLLCGCLFLTILLYCIESQFVRGKRARGKSVESITTGEEFKCSEIWDFDRIFWLLTASCFVVYGCVFPFNAIANSFFQERFDYSEHRATIMLMIPFTISAVVSPFLGGVIDKIGKRAWFVFLSPTFMAVAHTMLGFTKIEPIVWMAMIGLAFTFYAAALSPSFALVVPENKLGSAYGVLFAVQNVGLTSFPLIVGVIKDQTGGYTYVELCFVCLCAGGCLVAYFLIIEDRRTGSRLNLAHYKPDNVESETPIHSGVTDYQQLQDEVATV